MKRAALFVLAIGIFLGTRETAQAGPVLLTNRSDLSANDSINWANLGVASNSLVGNPVTITSANGATITATQASGQFRFFTGGQPQPPHWNGDFAIGDPILDTGEFNSTPGYSLTLHFASPIFGAVTQIDPERGGTFVARIRALDAIGNTLATFTRSGTADSPLDGSALVIGIKDTSADIYGIVFSLDSAGDNTNFEVAIDGVEIQANATPEPATLTLFGIGIIGMAGYGLRRHRKAKKRAA